MRTIILITLIIGTSCSMGKRLTDDKKAKIHYDSLAEKLFPNDSLKVTTSLDSVKIDFLSKVDFELMIDVRNLCQVISDSIGLRFKIENYNIKYFGELEIDKQIIEYDSALFPLVTQYLKRKDKKTFDSLKLKIGISPATIIDFHDKTVKYFAIKKQDNSYKDNKRHLTITYYLSELTEFPYPKSLIRLFVNDKDKVIESGTHWGYDKEREKEIDDEIDTSKTTIANIGSCCTTTLCV